MSTNNPIELKIGIVADTDGSKKGIQSQIDTLSKQLEGLNVDLKIDKEALKVFENLANVDFTKLLKGIDEIKQQTAGLAQVTKKELKDAWGEAGKSIGVDFGKNLDILEGDAKRVKKSLEDMNAVVVADYGFEDGIKQIKGMSVTVEKDGVKSFTRLKQVVESIGDNKDAIRWMPEAVRETDASLKTVYTSTSKFNEQLIKLRREGKITEDQFKFLNKEVDMLGKREGTKGLEDELTKLNRTTAEYQKITKDAADAKKKADADAAKAQKEQETNIQKLIKLETDLVAARRKHPDKVGKNPEADSIEAEIKRISKSSQIASGDVQELENRFRMVKAEATEAGRSSMTMAESFKVAMEKFPIWMAASTTFYGTVRSIRDAFQQIIELDSQMTVLKRVAGDGVEVNKVLEESVRLAGELGNEIADINEGFIAFARQGFRGDELASMAEHATLLGNISELGVEEAASVLTAGMKGFGIEAENVVRIVDSLNEVNVSASSYSNVS